MLLSLLNQLTHWLNDWVAAWLTEWVSKWLLDGNWQAAAATLATLHAVTFFYSYEFCLRCFCCCCWLLLFLATFIWVRNENENETRLDPHCFDRFGRICRLLRLAKCYTRSSMPQIKCDQIGQAAAAVATAMASLGNQIRMQTFVKGQSSQSVNQSICQSVNQSSKQVCNMQAQTRIDSTRLVRPSNN